MDIKERRPRARTTGPVIRALRLILVLGFILGGFLVGLYVGQTRGIPFVRKSGEWAIGIYIGSSPFNLQTPHGVKNPVLTKESVKDVSASFVADPFMLREGDKWYMFFEVLNKRTQQGDIGLATSENGLEWKYGQIVLDEPFHLSYPYVFQWDGQYWMIPESSRSSTIRLYRAVRFPLEWVLDRELLFGEYRDTTLFRHKDKWWMATSPTNGVLHLFYAEDLRGPWTAHPQNPLVAGNIQRGRCAGRVVEVDGRLIRFAQDGFPSYGSRVRALEITVLDTLHYEEKEIDQSPILKGSGKGWNSNGMHNIDLHLETAGRWIAAVDGFGPRLEWGREY
jgi:hypothetical protein